MSDWENDDVTLKIKALIQGEEISGISIEQPYSNRFIVLEFRSGKSLKIEVSWICGWEVLEAEKGK